MTPVVILTHNNLELTKKCVESVLVQNITASLFIFDNNSTDGTSEWIVEQGFTGLLHPENEGVSVGWNVGLDFEDGASSVLVLNNDTVIPPWFYSSLLSYDVPFISGVSVDVISAIQYPLQWEKPAPCPDFSAFLIRRDCWEKIGPFDERMKFYASDCDYHVRAHRAGIQLLNSGVPFYHERSSTLKNADPEERANISARANADRQAFREKYGTIPGEPEYGELFKPDLFGKGEVK
jgi:GT2 family glycosyltransferase